jgi:hypothetical protein
LRPTSKVLKYDMRLRIRNAGKGGLQRNAEAVVARGNTEIVNKTQLDGAR